MCLKRSELPNKHWFSTRLALLIFRAAAAENSLALAEPRRLEIKEGLLEDAAWLPDDGGDLRTY